MKKHFNISVTGIVQGVFFRASTKDEANKRDLVGFVRNEQDGSVYIEVEGDEEKLESFCKWCSQGPPRAKVNSCEVSEGELKHFQSFSIQ